MSRCGDNVEWPFVLYLDLGGYYTVHAVAGLTKERGVHQDAVGYSGLRIDVAAGCGEDSSRCNGHPSALQPNEGWATDNDIRHGWATVYESNDIFGTKPQDPIPQQHSSSEPHPTALIVARGYKPGQFFDHKFVADNVRFVRLSFGAAQQEGFIAASFNAFEVLGTTTTIKTKLSLALSANDATSSYLANSVSDSNTKFLPKPVAMAAGVRYWDLGGADGLVYKSGGTIRLAQHYTVATWVLFNDGDLCREFFCRRRAEAAAANAGDCAIVVSGKAMQLGVRKGGRMFNATAHIHDSGQWQLLVATGHQKMTTSSITCNHEGIDCGSAKTEFFGGVYQGRGPPAKAVHMGTIDVELSGMSIGRLGGGGGDCVGPGKVAGAFVWDRLLARDEMDGLLAAGPTASIGSLDKIAARPQPVSTAGQVASSEFLCPETVGQDWQLVRRVQPGSHWHQASDHLVGTAVYGEPCGATQDCSFSVKFADNNFNEYLFATGDCRRWLIAAKHAVSSVTDEHALGFHSFVWVLQSSNNA